jgi:hypothetical protein
MATLLEVDPSSTNLTVKSHNFLGLAVALAVHVHAVATVPATVSHADCVVRVELISLP